MKILDYGKTKSMECIFNVCKVAIESYRASILETNGLSLQGIIKVDKNGFP